MLRRILTYGLLSGALLLFSAAYWLVDTSAGLRIVLQAVVKTVPLPLSYENLQGTILSGISADKAQYRDDTVVVNISQFETKFSLRKLVSGRLAFDDVHASNVEVILLNNSSSDQPPQDNVTTGAAEEEYLPIPIIVRNVKLQKLHIADEQQPIYDFQNVSLSRGKILNNLAFKELAFTIDAGNLLTTGTIGFSESAAVELEASWQSVAADHFPQTRGTVSIKGSYQHFTVNGQVTAPEPLTLQGEIEDLFSQFNWKVALQGKRLPLTAFRQDIHAELHDFSFNANGNLDEVSVEGRSELWDTALGKWSSEINGQFDAKQIRLNVLKLVSLDAPATSISAKGSTGEDFSFDRQGPFNVDVSWKDLQWPLAGAPTVLSESGKLAITGSVKNYQVVLSEAGLLIDNHRISQLNASGDGNDKSLNIVSLKANYLSGAWQGSGKLAWGNDFQWDATVKVKGLDPSIQWPQWAANLNGQGSINGYHKQGDWRLAGEIKQLGGKLTDVPVDYGSLTFDLTENEFTVKNLKFKSGRNQVRGAVQLKLKSDTHRLINANWNIDAQNLARMFPEVKGAVRSQGNLRGELLAPQLSTSVQAQGLEYKDYKVATLAGRVNVDPSVNSDLLIDVKVDGLALGTSEIRTIQVKGNGTTGDHELVVKSILDEQRSLQLTAKGAYANEAWKGKLISSTMNTANFGEWKQRAPAALSVSQSQIALGNYCLSPAGTQGQVCAETNTDDFSGWKGTINVQDIPIAQFSRYFPPRIISTEGLVNGSGNYLFEGNVIKQLKASLVTKNGRVVYGLGVDKQQLNYRNVLANITKTEQGLLVESKMDLSDTGSAEAKVLLKDKNTLSALDASQKIEGRLAMDLKNLTILPMIITDIQYIEGHKHSEYNVTGTIGDPLIVGHSDITVSSVTLPRLGIELKDVKIKARSDKDRNIIVNGEARSGDGKVTVKGELTDYRNPDLLAKIQIEGENFLAAKLPEISIAVSPKLTATVKKDAMHLEGDLGIPKAHIQILQSAATVSPSSDVVIVNGEQKPEQPAKKFDFSAKVKVTLGYDVKLEGFGVISRLRGEVVVTEDPKGRTQGTGEITFAEGRYSAYNRELYIDSGRLTYASSPIDNPIVAIKAVRDIDDKTKVGVYVTGQAQNPKVELFSEPAMDQSDILSYMVLGYPMSQATKSDGSTLSSAAGSIGLIGGEILAKQIAERFGIDDVKVTSDSTTQQTSLALGKYLSPRLYAQYAMGIGQAVNTFRIEYELTSRWVLKTEASSEQQGADLFYTIEFD